ncbi:MAG: hypothetical protein JW902_01910 [Syntrophaceae bacterium]|nr:hypothetical protein [Syntrophaceae bacterium]
MRLINFFILLVLMSLPSTVSAQVRNNQVQSQNQVQTQNQGEEQQLQVTTQEQVSMQEGQDGEDESQTQSQTGSVSTRSETSRERMSAVARTVEELLTSQEAKGGIGEQISAVAREQRRIQGQIEEELDKLEARKGWVRKLFGPNYKAIKSLKQQMEQNRLRIQQLTQLKNQVVNQADETQLQEAIQALVEQNTALEEQTQAEEQVGSIFGWLARLLSV